MENNTSECDPTDVASTVPNVNNQRSICSDSQLEPETIHSLPQTSVPENTGNLSIGYPGQPNYRRGHSSDEGRKMEATTASASYWGFSTYPLEASPCCSCAAANNRCNTDSCSCYIAHQVCKPQCQSSQIGFDCLNQAICQCQCQPALPATPRTSTPAAKSPSKLQKICVKSDKCECARFNEQCNSTCACNRTCKNNTTPKTPTQKIQPAPAGCLCSKSKSQCGKKDCTCRAQMQYCNSACKCHANCGNISDHFRITKAIQNCFLEPKHDSSALVVSLTGSEYCYRDQFYRDTKSEPHTEEQFMTCLLQAVSKSKPDLDKITLYASKSPCFHQDCDPKCRVIEDCRDRRACAVLLKVLRQKVCRALQRTGIEFVVKFLYPHLHRGDLYTKQAVIVMMQGNITVEPLLMNDWSEIMKHSPISVEHSGDYLKLWNEHSLDKAAAKSQVIINDCRRAFGLPPKFWVAEIHDIVKSAIFNYADVRDRFHELNEGLRDLDLTATPSKMRITPGKRRSFLDIYELWDRILAKETKSAQATPERDPQTKQMVASFCGKSFDSSETDEIARRIIGTTGNIIAEIDALLVYLHDKGNW